jgi:hypothetical protein
MQNTVPLGPVDYLVIGHISCDMTSNGPSLGGTATYSAMMARALGLRVGVVTAWGWEIPLDILEGIQVRSVSVKHSTTFENIYTPEGRQQIVQHIAPDIFYKNIPMVWKESPIIHIGPIAGEGKHLMGAGFPASGLLGLTPQGWLRTWDKNGRIRIGSWPEASQTLPKVSAAVLSIEDVGGNEEQIEEMAVNCQVLAVTEGAAGSRLYWNGDLRKFHSLKVRELDPTGAGDIFAAAFFWRLSTTHDPWTAAKFATQLASYSVTRKGLEGIPTKQEIQSCLVEVM